MPPPLDPAPTRRSPPLRPDGTLGGDGLRKAVEASTEPTLQHTPATLKPTLKAGQITRATAPASGLPPELNNLSPAARFGKFVRVQKLGQGGMGEVWKAWDTELSRWVALKFLLGGDAEEIARFKREAQMAGKLSHPNIAAIYEVGTAQDRHYIAMQFVEGQTLKTFPRGNRRLHVRLIRDAALAVQFAHEQGIVHRDIKPENIMVVTRTKPATARTEKGKPAQSHHVYVMDFGLARATEGVSDLSVSGMVVGTPAYMSPEQSRGEKVDARADVYSLGASLYELITDRKPFVGKNVYDTIKKLQEEEAKPPRKIDSKIDVDLETIVLKCLEKDRARRYAGPADFAQELDRWLADEPIEARPISVAEKFVRKVQRNKVLSVVAGLGLTLAIASGVVFVVQRQTSEAALEAKDKGAREREARLRRLAVLWSAVVEKKAELRQLRSPVAISRPALEAAVAAVDEYIKEAPDSPQGLYIRARGRMYLGDLEPSKHDLREALARHPDFRPGWALLGMILITEYQSKLYAPHDSTRSERDRVYVDAAPLLRDAIDALARGWKPGEERMEAERWGLPWTRDDEVAQNVAGALRLMFVEHADAKALKFLEQQMAAYESEEYLAEIFRLSHQMRWLDRAIALAPGFEKLWHDRGTTKAELGNHRAAIADFDRAIELKNDYALAYVNRGIIKAILGEARAAIADYDRAIQLKRDNAEAYINRGNAKHDLGDFGSAIVDFDRAIGCESTSSVAHLNRGSAKLALGEHRAAIADYERAIELNKDFAEAYRGRGQALYRVDDHRAAIADFDHAIDLKKDYVEAYVDRGLAKKALGDPRAAIADFDYAIDLKKDFALAYLNRGNARGIVGNHHGAIADFDRAIELDKNLTLAYVNRGNAKQALGDFRGAIADCDRAINLNRDNALAFSNRGNAKLALGDLRAAIADYDRAIELKEDHSDAYANRGSAKRALDDLQGAITDYQAALRFAPRYWPHRASVEKFLCDARAMLKK